jgi:hypothetical protein
MPMTLNRELINVIRLQGSVVLKKRMGMSDSLEVQHKCASDRPTDAAAP